MNTYSNRRVANHLHGLIFELKERMNSRQDRPVMQKLNLVRMKKKKKKIFFFFFFFLFLILFNCKVVDTPFVEFKYLAKQYCLILRAKHLNSPKSNQNTKSSKKEKKNKPKQKKKKTKCILLSLFVSFFSS